MHSSINKPLQIVQVIHIRLQDNTAAAKGCNPLLYGLCGTWMGLVINQNLGP